MPGFLTYYANNKILDLLFGGVAATPPSTWYVGLATNPANRDGSVFEVPTTTDPGTGPVANGYARVAVTNNLTHFPAALNGLKNNASAIVFPAPTQNWGTVRTLFFADAATGGNVWLVSDLATPRTINGGAAAPQIAAGAAVLQDS